MNRTTNCLNMLPLNSPSPICRLRPQAAMSPPRQRRKCNQRTEFSLAAKDPMKTSVWFTLLALTSLRTADGFSTHIATTGMPPTRFVTSLASVWFTLLALTSLHTADGFSAHIATTGMPPTRFGTSLACQLLGVNSRAPHDFTSSFQKLARRGGEVDIHSHGWGLAYYCDKSKALRALRDPEAASSSPVAKSISKLRSQNMISHIRYATVGSVCVDNVHPFTRQLWGLDFVFAHNGDVPMFQGEHKAKVWLGVRSREKRVFQPVGDTDSEALFCAILNSLNARFCSMPPLPILHDYINTLCKEVVSYDGQSTILNFLLAFGEQTQIVYSWPGRREGSATWNGLHYKLKEQGDSGHVAVIATKPLDESGEEESDWVEMKRGECLMFENGEVHSAPDEDSYQAELFALNLFDDSFLQYSQLWGADAMTHVTKTQ